MPFVNVPIRGDLNMHYVVNPAAHQVGAELPDSQPLDPAKHTIVFLHAAMSSVASFKNQMADQRLSGAFNTVYLDSRFHGRTTGGERKEHTLENSAECILSVLDLLEIPQYSLFCEGVWGCQTGLYVAIHRPKLVKSLLLASPGWMIEKPDVRSSLLQLAEIFEEDKMTGNGALSEEAGEILCDYFIGNAPRVRQRRDEAKIVWEKRYGKGHNVHDIRHLCRATALRTPISPSALARITAPVLIIAGTEDRNVSPVAAGNEWARALSSARGGAQVTTITGAPHLMSLTDYSILNRMILQFTARSIAK